MNVMLGDLINISKKLPQQINLTETNITNITADIERRNQNKSEEFSMKLGNRTFDERKSAGDLLVNAVLSNKYNDKIVGSFCGFEIGILSPNFFDNRQIVLVGNGRYTEIEDKAFNFKEFFRTWTGNPEIDGKVKPENANIGDFIHENDVKSFLNLITKDDEDSNYPYSNKQYRDLFKHTLWMVPRS